MNDLHRLIEALVQRIVAAFQYATVEEIEALPGSPRVPPAGPERTRSYGAPRYSRARAHYEHEVAGFWRMQPVGPEKSKRRKTWINPHWRGNPELAPSRPTILRRARAR